MDSVESLHRRAMDLAHEGDVLQRLHRDDDAQTAYLAASRLELEAAELWNHEERETQPTLCILLSSAASLALDGGQPSLAANLIDRAVAAGVPAAETAAIAGLRGRVAMALARPRVPPPDRLSDKRGVRSDTNAPSGAIEVGQTTAEREPSSDAHHPLSGATVPAGLTGHPGKALVDTGVRRHDIDVIHYDDTFETIVVGPHNQLAVHAAKAVLGTLGHLYNPLFVHGRAGLGKTHLLQALRHALHAITPRPRILYASCALFINQFMSAVETGELEAFRARYRNTDVLLIDDVHHLADKQRSQNEFCQTFDALYALNKQIVLSSDSQPSDIPALSDRLIVRFKRGMICTIEPPLFDTRVRIASLRARQLGAHVPTVVLDFIAHHVETNLRELTGAVTQVVGMSMLMKQDVTLAMARDVLSSLVTDRRHEITLDEIVKAVIEFTGIRRSTLQSKRPSQSLSDFRHLCMFLARSLTRLSPEEIGAYFGSQNDRAVLDAAEQVKTRLVRDPAFRRLVEGLVQRVGGSLQA